MVQIVAGPASPSATRSHPLISVMPLEPSGICNALETTKALSVSAITFLAFISHFFLIIPFSVPARLRLGPYPHAARS